MEELINAISRLNKGSCGGPDGISAKLLEGFIEQCPNLTLKALNDQMCIGDTQDKPINNRNIIFIPKPSDRIDIKKIPPDLPSQHTIQTLRHMPDSKNYPRDRTIQHFQP